MLVVLKQNNQLPRCRPRVRCAPSTGYLRRDGTPMHPRRPGR